MDLKEIDEPMVIYCRQSMDYLPNPVACKVTGMSPQHVNENGVSENDFIKQIVAQIGKASTCSLGYNSIRFDDEFTRYTLFRNFYDPYEHEYKDGSNRWDLLDIVRLTRALRPEGINWPVKEDGSPSNQLEKLSVANGIEHGQAHDALSDVRATIGMARLIRKKQPRLFDYAFANRSKQALSTLLNLANPQVRLLVSGTIPSQRSHIAAILPLAQHPENRNSIIVLDLDQDPSALLDMSADDIAQSLLAKQSGNDESTLNGRPGLRNVQVNKCPVIVPLNTLRSEDAQRLNINLTQVNQHELVARKLLEPDMRQKIISAMNRSWPEVNSDVEGSLYGGAFLSQQDKQRAIKLRKSKPQAIQNIGAHFEDRRLIELAWRYQARNYRDTLDQKDQLRWQDHCRERLNDVTAPWLSFEAFDEAILSTIWTEDDAALKQTLVDYRRIIYEHAQTSHPVQADSAPA